MLMLISKCGNYVQVIGLLLQGIKSCAGPLRLLYSIPVVE
jgi:hypothetical protein